jgi:putative aminopeptidase FrvX
MVAVPAGAQSGRAPGASDAPPHVQAIASWIALDAAPGHEQRATGAIMAAMPGWHRDALGNLVLHRGAGRPRRVVACGIDQPSYVVSAISNDGYLRLHSAVRARRDPLWDQFHEGQRIRIRTRAGEVPGVVGVPSVHLTRGRGADTARASAEEFWVDVGARSAEDVAELGIALLDPVSRDWPVWVFDTLAAGPAASARTGCAAVAAAARATPAHGETIFVISAQSSFAWAGLGAAVAPLGTIDTLVIAAPLPVRRGRGGAQADAVARPPFASNPSVHIGATVVLRAPASFAGTLVESVGEQSAADYFQAVAQAAGIDVRQHPVAPLAIATAASRSSHGTSAKAPSPAYAADDSLAGVAALLSTLTNTYAVSGHEAPMRAAVLRALPPWARARARIDAAGNIVLALGPDRDTSVFVAHLDEVGWEVTGIEHDGTVRLRTRGGFFHSLWEGQTALLHFDRDSLSTNPSPLPGVFVPRDRPATKQPATLTAWFGLDSAALVARGVRVGQQVTSYKTATRLGAVRFTNRSIDDRAGCTSLILAVRAIDPTTLRHKVIFLWSVSEETGLEGASAFAAQHARATHRVYAIDTFVSSDSPLDSHHFADTPIGAGVVARALDNSSVTPPAEVDHVVATAKAASVPLQIGTTNGGNDGSAFVHYGTIDVPIGWPLRYSHSPVELIDLRDVRSLARLVAALATN